MKKKAMFFGGGNPFLHKPLVMQIDTTLAGNTASNQYAIPISVNMVSNVTVDWGDGTVTDINGTFYSATDPAPLIHTYDTEGIYTIKVARNDGSTGLNFSHIYAKVNDRVKVLKILDWGETSMVGTNNVYHRGRFEKCENLTEIPAGGNDYFGLGDGSASTFDAAFNGCTNLTIPDLHLWTFESDCSYGNAFQDCTSLNASSLSFSFDGSHSSMFYGCTSLAPSSITGTMLGDGPSCFRGCTSLNPSVINLTVGNITDTNYRSVQFRGCTALTNPDVTITIYENASAWADFAYMFYYCSSFNPNSLVINQTNTTTQRIANTNYMFFNCSVFNHDVENLVLDSGCDMQYMFFQCRSFNSSLANWTIPLTSNSRYMFDDCSVFTGIGIDTWVNPTFGGSMDVMFRNCVLLNIDLDHFNVDAVTNMSNTFFGCNIFNGDLSNWNVNVSGFNSVFQNCYAFEGIGMDTWTELTVTGSMFRSFMDCGVLNNFPDVSVIDFTGVTSMQDTFKDCTLFNKPIPQVAMPSCTRFLSTFLGCSAFNQDVANIVTSTATTIASMFNGCSNFNGSVLGWDTSSVTTMNSTFYQNSTFNQPVNHFDTSSCGNYQNMFRDCILFNQPISNFDWSNKTSVVLEQILQGCIAFNSAIPQNVVVGANADLQDMFIGCDVFDQDLSSWDMSAFEGTNGNFYFRITNDSYSHLDAIYDAWAAQSLQTTSAIDLYFGNATYTAVGAVGRLVLTDTHLWQIFDGGQV